MISPHEIMLLSTLLKRDIAQDIQLLTQVRDAVGQALNKEDQVFVSNNLFSGLNFLKTEEGKKALQDFVASWKATVEPKKEPTEKIDSTIIA